MTAAAEEVRPWCAYDMRRKRLAFATTDGDVVTLRRPGSTETWQAPVAEVRPATAVHEVIEIAQAEHGRR